MKTLILFFAISISLMSCNKYKDETVDTRFVTYNVTCSHSGVDISFVNKDGQTETKTITKEFWDTTFVNNTAITLSISAKAHNIHSYLGIGIVYNQTLMKKAEIDNSDDQVNLCETSCELVIK